MQSKIKIVLTIVVVTSILALGFIGYTHYRPTRIIIQPQAIEKRGVPSSQSDAASKIDSTPTPPTTTPTPSEQSNSNPTTANLSISNFSQSDGLVKATAAITVQQQGSCIFNFTSSHTKSVTRTVQSTILSSSTMTCHTEINQAEFTKLGDWNLDVVFMNENTKLEQSQNVTIN